MNREVSATQYGDGANSQFTYPSKNMSKTGISKYKIMFADRHHQSFEETTFFEGKKGCREKCGKNDHARRKTRNSTLSEMSERLLYRGIRVEGAGGMA